VRPQWPATAGLPVSIQPRCEQCKRPHRVDLPCWHGDYRRRVCEQVYREKGRRCWQCRREGKDAAAATIDHVVARARGGGDEMRNLEPLCQLHNASKGSRDSDPYGPLPPISGNGKPVSPRFR
jgi:5-methylcytosine-specific restriction endonuclease McrA